MGSPLFDKAVLSLPGGKQFTVTVKGRKEDPYIQQVLLNGKPYRSVSISHVTIMAGGKIEFTMGAQPNKNWFDNVCF